MVYFPYTLSPNPCSRCPNSLAIYFTHVFLCLSIFLGVCIQATPLFCHQLLSFLEYQDNDGILCPLMFVLHGLQRTLCPHDCILYFTSFMPGGLFLHWLGYRN